MNGSGKRYTAEFREEAVRLSQQENRTVGEVAASLGVGQSTLQKWRRMAGVVSGVPVEPPERSQAETEAENRRLRKELEIVKMEREILKKAATFFANETKG